MKLRSTDITDSSLGRLLALCSLSLTSLDISYTNVKSLDILSSALYSRTTPWRFIKLVASGLPLSPGTLVKFLKPLSELLDSEKNQFHTLKLGSITASSTKYSEGLTDQYLTEILPYLEKLEGLKHISFYQNFNLGKSIQPLSRFMEIVGRRCISLDLSLPLSDWHLDGLFPFSLEDMLGGEIIEEVAPKLEILILNGSRITDVSASAISQCKNLRSLYVAETKISSKCFSLTSLSFLLLVLILYSRFVNS